VIKTQVEQEENGIINNVVASASYFSILFPLLAGSGKPFRRFHSKHSIEYQIY
jgi:hypothetical protein